MPTVESPVSIVKLPLVPLVPQRLSSVASAIDPITPPAEAFEFFDIFIVADQVDVVGAPVPDTMLIILPQIYHMPPLPPISEAAPPLTEIDQLLTRLSDNPSLLFE